jgi:hypothetical protein
MDSADLKAALERFKHAQTHYRHWSHAYYYTDGVAYLAAQAGANWLLDYIAAHQKRARRDPSLRECQVWTLRKTGAFSARIACSREDGDDVFYDDVTVFGGFPLDEVTLYLESETLMLPGER